MAAALRPTPKHAPLLPGLGETADPSEKHPLVPAPPVGDAAPRWVEGTRVLAWLLSLALQGLGLLELAMLVTLGRAEPFQVAGPVLRAVGVALCQALYTVAGPHPPPAWPFAVTLPTWVLSAATKLTAGTMAGSPSGAGGLAEAVRRGDGALCLALALCDAATLIGLLCGGKSPSPLAAKDTPASAGTPSPIVAAQLTDPQLLYCSDRVGFLSRLTYGWLTPLMRDGYRRPIDLEQLGKLPAYDSAALNFERVRGRWERPRPADQPPGLLRPLWKEYALPMAVAYLCKQSADLLGFAGPVALKGIVQFMTEQGDPGHAPPTEATLAAVLSNGWVLALLLFLAPALQSVLFQMHQFLTFRVCGQVQAALLALLYAKALTLNPDTLPPDVTPGSIVNHMAVDAVAVGQMFQFALAVFTIPVQIALTLYLLYWNIGWAGPASLGVVVLLAPVMGCLGKMSARLQKAMLEQNDQRLRLINELLQGIKIIKFYAWEASFVARVAAVREAQLGLLLRRKLCGACTICLALSTPALLTVAGFALYTHWSAAPLTPGVAFSALALFNVLLTPMIILPVTIQSWINAAVSATRIVRFLRLPDMERSFFREDADVTTALAAEVDGTFAWPRTGTAEEADEEAGEGLRPFTFQAQLPRGTLTLVVGPVGSGKSTFLKALLGTVPCLQGKVRLHGPVAYGAQQAALFHASLRDNILFGAALDSKRYAEVLEASGLRQDLAALPAGDRTEIGSKGINLSGGQKQRVSLARALYSQAPVVVLDDPLAALDAHVAEHVFAKAVQEMLVARGKTVVMSTHQWQFLKLADQVLLVRDHRVVARGTCEELQAQGHDLAFEAYQPPAPMEASAVVPVEEPEAEPPLPDSFRQRGSSTSRERSLSRASRHSRHSATEAAASGALVTAEERGAGAVALAVYARYISACGAPWIALMVVTQVLVRVANVAATLLLADWAEQANREVPAHPVEHYLTSFVGLTLASTLVAGVGNVCVSMAIVRAARALHARMLDCVVRCPMAFFDTTPLGRILTRFSTDTSTVDMPLPDTLNQSFQLLLNLASYLLTIVFVTPVLVVFLFPVSVAYWFLQHFFRFSARELQRLNAISRSPIYAHLSETLLGLPTLRAYGAGRRFLHATMAHVDRNTLAFMTLNGATRWAGLRLDLLGAGVVSTTALACLASQGAITPSLAGMALSYAWAFVQYVSFTIKSCTETEMNMNSVERMAHYTTLETELSAVVPPGAVEPVDAAWPAHGAIAVQGLTAAYRPGLPPVLRGVSLDIAPGQRVGVCGRTGSGKSSLLLALFRMLRIERGAITIDGRDIAHVPLPVLRSRMAVIPQDPVLFAGTVRSNLDPEGRYTDDEVWQAIRVAQLETCVHSLLQEVGEDGDALSTGQRQLVCLARAFLKRARVLCLDEATASVDQDTDRLIQLLLRQAFQGCTVITIAHRITTILDYDKVLVLGDGRVLEFDRPTALLQTNSAFKALVESS